MKVGSDIIYLGRGTENFGGGLKKKFNFEAPKKDQKSFKPQRRGEKDWIGIKSRINYQHHFSGTIETPAEDIIEGYSGLLCPPCVYSGGRISRPFCFLFCFFDKFEPWISRRYPRKKIFIFTRISRKKSTHERKKSRLFLSKCFLSLDFRGKNAVSMEFQIFYMLKHITPYSMGRVSCVTQDFSIWEGSEGANVSSPVSRTMYNVHGRGA